SFSQAQGFPPGIPEDHRQVQRQETEEGVEENAEHLGITELSVQDGTRKEMSTGKPTGIKLQAGVVIPEDSESHAGCGTRELCDAGVLRKITLAAKVWRKISDCRLV
ncbi:hypothetical protein P7K49_020187, partial [Saguinus oedipus]